MIKNIILIVLVCGSLGSTVADFKDDSLKLHNSLRVKHSSPAMTQSGDINTYSQKWATQMASSGKFAHSDSKGKYGENIYYYEGGSITDTQAVTDAIISWYNEIAKYNFDKPGFSGETGHFTQVVWKDSKNLGISIARNGKKVYVCANYSPPGNFQDKFAANVLKNK